MSYFNIRSTASFRWFEFRKHAARFLVRIAQRIDPISPDVAAFHLQQTLDMIAYGECFTKIGPLDENLKPTTLTENQIVKTANYL